MRRRFDGGMRFVRCESRTPPGHRPIKITIGERGVKGYCADYRCSYSVRVIVVPLIIPQIPAPR
ncbi:hypothetical protein [Bradyrhizobium sp. UFLA05-112]